MNITSPPKRWSTHLTRLYPMTTPTQSWLDPWTRPIAYEPSKEETLRKGSPSFTLKDRKQKKARQDLCNNCFYNASPAIDSNSSVTASCMHILWPIACMKDAFCRSSSKLWVDSSVVSTLNCQIISDLNQVMCISNLLLWDWLVSTHAVKNIFLFDYHEQNNRVHQVYPLLHEI